MIDLALDNRLYINDNLNEAIQELDLLFCTENTELIGDTSFGVSLDQFIWTLTPMTESLKEYLNEKLHTLTYLNLFRYNLDVKYENEDFKSIYRIIIDIYIDQNQKLRKEYKFV